MTAMNDDVLLEFYHKGFFSPLDYYFARFIGDVSGGSAPAAVTLSAALVSKVTGEGHACLDLATLAGKTVVAGEDGSFTFSYPELGQWKRLLGRNGAVGKPGDTTPLVLDGRNRLYLYRYWEYEQTIAQALRQRARQWGVKIDKKRLQEGVVRLFAASDTEETDWQRIAAVTAVLRRICIISGGPGTGKTTTVAKILVLLIEQAEEKGLSIGLAAPTGKAAARLQEAIVRAKHEVDCSASVRKAIPEETFTVHRMLGVMPLSPYFRHNCTNPLPFDVVVVDEGSMVSLALMARLIEALPEASRLILLGDKDQLGSVESGAVLGSICDPGRTRAFTRDHCKTVEGITGGTAGMIAKGGGEADGFQDCIVELRKNYRFGVRSGIGKLSQAVRRGDGEAALSLLRQRKFQDISWATMPALTVLRKAVRDVVVQGYQRYLQSNDPKEALGLFDRFRIVCAVRQGPYGVENLNALVERILRHEGLIKPERQWYSGRPIMILRNDYQLRLFNGDVGLLLPDAGLDGELRAFFYGADGGVRGFAPPRLPEHETVYAMTVHKSQGSEFEQVLFVMPDRDLPLLTRELIYTAISRTKGRISLWGNEDVFRIAVSRRVMRASGLHDALWSN